MHAGRTLNGRSRRTRSPCRGGNCIHRMSARYSGPICSCFDEYAGAGNSVAQGFMMVELYPLKGADCVQLVVRQSRPFLARDNHGALKRRGVLNVFSRQSVNVREVRIEVHPVRGIDKRIECVGYLSAAYADQTD